MNSQGYILKIHTESSGKSKSDVFSLNLQRKTLHIPVFVVVKDSSNGPNCSIKQTTNPLLHSLLLKPKF